MDDVPACQATKAGGVDSLESLLGRLKSLKIRALVFRQLFEDDVAVYFPPRLVSFTVNQVWRQCYFTIWPMRYISMLRVICLHPWNM